MGAWHAVRASGELHGSEGTLKLEPKVMDLLFLLAAQPGRVVARERILETLWPGVIVGDDSLARTVSKLRQALGDDAKQPRYIETIAKRGYRLLAEVGPAAGDAPVAAPPRRSPRLVWMLLAAAVALTLGGWLAWPGGIRTDAPPPATDPMLARADDYYFQFSRGDNEAAIELYERVLGLHPDEPAALAGLANALAQRCIRWPPGEREFTRLGDALADGHLDSEPSRAQLARAQSLAERAVALAPGSAAAHKALGLVASTQRRFDVALDSYHRAVELDADAWGAMIDIGDVLEITGRGDEALPYFEHAYAAMTREYARTPVQVRPWHAELGVLIATRHAARGDRSAAEAWYRRVLAQSPLHPGATAGLAALLRAGGDAGEAERLCAELEQRLGPERTCAQP